MGIKPVYTKIINLAYPEIGDFQSIKNIRMLEKVTVKMLNYVYFQQQGCIIIKILQKL